MVKGGEKSGRTATRRKRPRPRTSGRLKTSAYRKPNAVEVQVERSTIRKVLLVARIHRLFSERWR
jgi:hypothetical protein